MAEREAVADVQCKVIIENRQLIEALYAHLGLEMPGAPVDPPPVDPPPPTGGAVTEPPALVDPIDVEVTNANAKLRLDPTKDYRLHCAEVIDAQGGVVISGGHNVVAIGGEVNFSRDYSDASVSVGKANRCLYIKDNTGVVHVEGWKLGGAVVGEGIDLSCPDAEAVHLVNMQVVTTSGSQTSNHADLVQTWAGPKKLVIDGFTGTTKYQGFFLLPTQWASVPGLTEWSFRRINLNGTDTAGYLYWLADSTNGPAPSVTVEDCWGNPNPNKPSRDQWLWPQGDPKWDAVKQGTPGDFVTNAGVNYTRS